MTDLSDQFAEQQSNVIDWNGVQLYGLLQLDEVPERLRVTFIGSKSSPVQGIQIRMRGGTVRANGKKSENLLLWTDTAPDTVELEFCRRPGGHPSSLKMWNVWRGGLGVTQAWLGNAALQVEGDVESGQLLLRCSDGEGEPNFDDLVVEVLVNPR